MNEINVGRLPFEDLAMLLTMFTGRYRDYRFYAYWEVNAGPDDNGDMMWTASLAITTAGGAPGRANHESRYVTSNMTGPDSAMATLLRTIADSYPTLWQETVDEFAAQKQAEAIAAAVFAWQYEADEIEHGEWLANLQPGWTTPDGKLTVERVDDSGVHCNVNATGELWSTHPGNFARVFAP